uniref:Uncharacterized protein n=1 Tax=Anthurium amnicola TaxID=1678845 RepID=A0A1D1Z4Z4_9ARAE
MNQKYFIFLFTLLAFFLEKTHGCHPSGVLNQEDYDCTPGWNGVNITDVSWDKDSPKMYITTYTPDGNNGPNAPHAYGHFTFSAGDKRDRFVGNPRFVNTHHCTVKGSNEVNPFASYWLYDEKNRPADGSTFTVWLAIYWYCYYADLGGGIQCCHKNVNYTNTVKY